MSMAFSISYMLMKTTLNLKNMVAFLLDRSTGTSLKYFRFQCQIQSWHFPPASSTGHLSVMAPPHVEGHSENLLHLPIPGPKTHVSLVTRQHILLFASYLTPAQSIFNTTAIEWVSLFAFSSLFHISTRKTVVVSEPSVWFLYLCLLFAGAEQAPLKSWSVQTWINWLLQ